MEGVLKPSERLLLAVRQLGAYHTAVSVACALRNWEFDCADHEEVVNLQFHAKFSPDPKLIDASISLISSLICSANIWM